MESSLQVCCNNFNINYVISPQVIQWWEEKAKTYGPVLSGALFGAGWWFWVDAVCSSDMKIPFVQYLPGIIATIALIMINAVRMEELQELDSFDDAAYCRSRIWLFFCYMVSFGAIVGSVVILLQHYVGTTIVWPGVAGIFQVTLVLGSALLLWVSRTPTDSSDNYMGF